MKKTLLKILLVFVCATLLTACGFKLRSDTSLPPQLNNTYYNATNPYGQFEVSLKKSLTNSGIVLAKNSNTAKSTINIASSFSYSATSPATSTQARTYTLTYSATINIINAHGKVLVGTQPVSTSRTLVLAPGEIFEISPQVETNKQEMRQDLVFKILNILSSQKVSQALITS